MNDEPQVPQPAWIARAVGLSLLALSIAVAVGAGNIEFAFSSDPLGPRAVPYILAGFLAVCSLWYLAQPGHSEPWADAGTLWRAVALIAVTAGGVGLMNIIGFVPMAVAMSFVAARLFGATWPGAAAIGVAQGALWFVLFKYALGTYLPAGTLFFPG